MNGPVVVRRSYALGNSHLILQSLESQRAQCTRPAGRTSTLAHPKPSGNAMDTHPQHPLGTPTRPGTKSVLGLSAPRGGRGEVGGDLAGGPLGSIHHFAIQFPNSLWWNSLLDPEAAASLLGCARLHHHFFFFGAWEAWAAWNPSTLVAPPADGLSPNSSSVVRPGAEACHQPRPRLFALASPAFSRSTLISFYLSSLL